MNDTRKQIIDIIWEYMNKKRCYWCLELVIKTWKIIPCQEVKYEDETKILWHYDLSAVLQYMYDYEKRWNILNIEPWQWSNEWWTLFWFYIDQIHENYLLPNKPLHLYTDQEDTDLLIILKWL